MAWRWFSSATYAPCFKALSLEFCLAAGLRGPVECWALWRAAASNWGVSWGDFRKDMVPPGTDCWDSEERTSSGIEVLTKIGYHRGEGLSRDNVSTCLAQHESD